MKPLRTVALVVLFGGVAFGQETVDAVLQKIQKTKFSALDGEFTQSNRMKLFKQELKSRGRFSFHKPRQIRWEYLDPDPSKLELDGQKATLSSPGAPPQTFDLEKDQTMRTIFDQLLLWFGGGSMEDAKKMYTLSASGNEREPTLLLTPKPDQVVARAFRSIELHFDGKTMLLRKIRLVEPGGDEKEITFTKTRATP